jgi:DOPA 4,5-dioxygenase
MTGAVLETNSPRNDYENYHAHVYYDAQSHQQAERLIERVRDELDVSIGRMHQKPVGPHPMWSCQLAFGRQDFDSVIPWLEQNRDGLTVFVHGLTGDDYADHTLHTSWLGDAVELDLSCFTPPS